MLVNKQLVAIEFHRIFFHMEDNATADWEVVA